MSADNITTIQITVAEYVELNSRLAFAEGALTALGSRLRKASEETFSSDMKAEIENAVADIDNVLLTVSPVRAECTGAR
jgi:hypothetical protein